MKQGTCRNCGKSFQHNRAVRHTCSHECTVTYHNRAKKGLDRTTPDGRVIPYKKNCKFCGKEFESKFKNRGDFCCVEHLREFTKERDKQNIKRARVVRMQDPEKYFRVLYGVVGARGHRKQGKEKTITASDLFQLWKTQDGKCAVTGRQMTMTFGKGYVLTNVSVDRIIPSGPYTKANVRLVCRIVNQMKYQLSDSEWLGWCQDIVKGLGSELV